MELSRKLWDFQADALGLDIRLVPQEMEIAAAAIDPPSVASLERAIAQCEFLAGQWNRLRRLGERPAGKVFDAAAAATDRLWGQHVLVSLLLWRWSGESDLALAKAVLEGQLSRMQQEAAA